MAVDLLYEDRRLLALVVLINVIGSAFGLYYYWDQLMMTPWYYWIFVPDCPLYTFFMIFALAFIALGKRFDTFNVITAVGLAMYGVWTMLVLIYFREIFFTPENALMSAALWASHGSMALESVWLLPYVKKAGVVAWLVAGVWFFIQVVFDYFVRFTYAGQTMRLHPLAILEYYTQGTGSYGLLLPKLDMTMYMTFAMVFIFLALMFVAARKWAFIVDMPELSLKKLKIKN